MKKITLSFVAVIFSVNGFSQSDPGIQWQKTIGGSSEDILNSIRQTTDGGYILGGVSFSNISGNKTENSMGNADYWIVKADASGNILWQNTIGGSNYDYLTSMQQTADGGYILGGYSSSNISGDKTENNRDTTLTTWDYWIVKTDITGNIQWQNTIGGSSHDYLSSIQQTADSGYILGGWSGSNISGDKTDSSNGGSDYWMVKIDTAGYIQWQNTIGGGNHDNLYTIQQTSDSGYILGGSSSSNASGDKTENSKGGSDYWIVKTDTAGNIQWQNTIGGDGTDELYSVQQTDDGGYILGGYSGSYSSGDKTENTIGVTGYNDYWIIKTDAAGNIQWQNTIGGNAWDYLSSIKQTTDGGYIIGGFSNSNSNFYGDKTENSNGIWDYWIVKTDDAGNIQWQNTIWGSDIDRLYYIEQTDDGGYIAGGLSYSSVSGDKTDNCVGGADYWVVKLSPYVGIDEAIANKTLHVFPNPATNELTIDNGELKIESVEIYSILGEKVYSQPQTSNLKPQTVDVSQLPSGIYFVKVKTDNGISAAKFVKK